MLWDTIPMASFSFFLIIIYHKTKSTALLLSLLCDENNIPPRIKKRAITLPGDCSFHFAHSCVLYSFIQRNASSPLLNRI